MEKIPNNIYRKIQELSFEVKQELRKKGVVAPVKNNDGSVGIGCYRIVKGQNGYTVLDDHDDVVEQDLNLPQTAVLLANDLALGKFRDKNIVDQDRRYGYALFEEELHNRKTAKKKITLEYFDVSIAKAAEAKGRKEYYKKDLLNKYEKLMRLV
jgi:hypothetical protein